jgi:hypothetical protein
MRLYIWEGHGISSGYHDDGTLVVLAESAEQAREVARATNPKDHEDHEGYQSWRANTNDPVVWSDRWLTYYGSDERGEEAIEREPDRVVELDAPCLVVFNGGGYD